MANTIKNWLNLQKIEKIEEISNNDLTSFLCVFYSCVVKQPSTHQKSRQNIDGIFQKFAILTENPITFDETCSVILRTVLCLKFMLRGFQIDDYVFQGGFRFVSLCIALTRTRLGLIFQSNI